MIVYDLRCGAGHVFEAWFGSSGSYDGQHARGDLVCPFCGDTQVDKAVMAPSIPAKSNGRSPSASPTAVKEALKTMAEHQAKALESSKWVGSTFAARARAIHAGKEPIIPIHGQASLAEANALIEEGVAIAPLPFAIVPPKSRH